MIHIFLQAYLNVPFCERKLRELSEDDNNVQLQGVMEELQLVSNRKIKNWKHDILKNGVSSLYPKVRKVEHLKLNNNLGPFTEDHSMLI